MPGSRGAAADRLRSGDLSDRAAFPPGQRIDHRGADLPLLHPDAAQPSVGKGLDAVSTNRPKQSLLDDFKRLWATNFLDNLWIETIDEPFANGVVGKRVIYHMEERPRVKIVDYTGSTKVERTKIDEKMKELGIALRLDSFLDQAVVKRVQGLVKSFMAEKGYEFAEVTSTVEPLPAGPKLVKVVFDVDGRTEGQGPHHQLQRQHRGQRRHAGEADEVHEGAQLAVVDHRQGHLQRKQVRRRRRKDHRVLPQQGLHRRARRPARDQDRSKTATTRKRAGSQLNIPIDEGPRYRVGDLEVRRQQDHQDRVPRAVLQAEAGRLVLGQADSQGLIKAREGYGSLGYFEFTGFPDLEPVGGAEGPIAGPADPTVNVTMRMTEGEQYFVNRLTFAGNTTTRDNVIRREVRLLEGAPFNTEALKYSVKRLNQLGYFKPLEEGQGVDVQKTPGEKNQVDVTLKLEEQNRNQLTFGAGVSQFEGFFGQLSFQTSNFLGRGESLTVSLQMGSRSENYQVAFTEPFLFDRNITGGVDVYKRTLRYIDQFTQDATGGNVTTRFPAGRLLAHVHDLQLRGDDGIGLESDLLRARAGPAQSVPARFAAARRRRQAHRQQGDAELRPQHRRQPDLPELRHAPDRVDRLRGPWRQHQLPQAAVRIRALPAAQSAHVVRLPHADRVHPPDCEHARICRSPKRCIWAASTRSAASTSARSVRRISKPASCSAATRRMLFNAEYLINIAGPVRLVLFADTGQVRNIGQSFAWKEDINVRVDPGLPPIIDPFSTTRLIDPNAPPPYLQKVGETNAFKTSTGAEIRFFMPVLNVPFRLIFAYNPSRFGVLDNNLQPAKKFTFKFAVGSTF